MSNFLVCYIYLYLFIIERDITINEKTKNLCNWLGRALIKLTQNNKKGLLCHQQRIIG